MMGIIEIVLIKNFVIIRNKNYVTWLMISRKYYKLITVLKKTIIMTDENKTYRELFNTLILLCAIFTLLGKAQYSLPYNQWNYENS